MRPFLLTLLLCAPGAARGVQPETGALKARLAKLEARLADYDQRTARDSTIPKDAVRQELAEKVRELKQDIDTGLPAAEIEDKLSGAEELCARLLDSIQGLARDFDRERTEQEAAFGRPELEAALARARTGPVSAADVREIASYYTRNEMSRELHDFSHEVLAAIPYREGLPYDDDPRALASGHAMTAATHLEPEELRKDARAFLREYRKGAPEWVVDQAKSLVKLAKQKLKKRR